MKFQKIDLKPRAPGNGLTYLKIADGESVIAVLRGEIHHFYTRWNEGKSENVIEGTPGAKSRFSVNAVIQENGKLQAKIWDFGLAVYQQLADIAEAYPITQTKIKITRRGTKLDTTYMILPLLKDEDKLTQQQRLAIEAVELNILDKAPTKQAPASAPSEDDNWGGFA